jgi:hypothetical protein
LDDFEKEIENLNQRTEELYTSVEFYESYFYSANNPDAAPIQIINELKGVNIAFRYLGDNTNTIETL